ncbi:MAG: hypothetical protein AMXMBFR8_06710 [Nevskiales bacterium]
MKRRAIILWLLNLLVLIGAADVAAAPSCVNDLLNGERDVTTTVDVLANDTGLDLPPITVTIVQPPSQGSAAVTPGNAIAFTPPAATGGAFTIGYQVSDGASLTAECTATILVNDFPVAVDDQFDVPMSTPWALAVRLNDQNLTDTPINIEITRQPDHGAVEVVFNPSSGFPFIGYTPNTGYAGPDSLDYRIVDCNSVLDVGADGFCTSPRDPSNVATVTINVVSIPIAGDDGIPFPIPFRTIRNQPITIDVLANDEGLVDTPITVRIAEDAEGNPLVFNGTAVVNSDNTVTFTPNPDFVGRNPSPGVLPIKDAVGSFQPNELVIISDPRGDATALIDSILADRLLIEFSDVFLTPLTITAGSTVTGLFSGATAVVTDGYVPACPNINCMPTDTGFLYQLVDGDGQPDEVVGDAADQDDSQGAVAVDVFPGRTTDTGGSSLGWELFALLAAAVLRPRWTARGRNRTGTIL